MLRPDVYDVSPRLPKEVEKFVVHNTEWLLEQMAQLQDQIDECKRKKPKEKEDGTDTTGD